MAQHLTCRTVAAGTEAAAATELAAAAASRGLAATTFVAPGLLVALTDEDAPAPLAGTAAMDVVIDRVAGTGGSLHALRYPIRPGMADVAEQVFRGSGDPPLRAGSTRLLRTTVYRHGDVLVRVFAIDGDVGELVEGLARAVEVHDVGRRMGALFTGAYDFTTRDGLRAFFRDNLMRPAGRSGESEAAA
jgi:hypothetical protein